MNKEFDRNGLHDDILEALEERIGEEGVDFILIIQKLHQIMTNCQPLDVASHCSSVVNTYLQGNQEVHHNSLENNLDS